jgi:hypothetical protein
MAAGVRRAIEDRYLTVLDGFLKRTGRAQSAWLRHGL